MHFCFSSILSSRNLPTVDQPAGGENWNAVKTCLPRRPVGA